MVAGRRGALGRTGGRAAVIELLVGVIADTATPERVDRLLADLCLLAAQERGRCEVRVVLLDNPGSGPDVARVNALLDQHRRAGLDLQVLRAEGAHAGERLPIAMARTQVQRGCARLARDPAQACAWILDEDLRLAPLLAKASEGLRISDEIQEARRLGVDVVISPIVGAPPLPARSMVRVNLEDLQRHLALIATLGPDERWPDRRADNEQVRQRLAEYYYDHSCAHGDAAEWPMWLEPANPEENVRGVFLRLCERSAGMRYGEPVTRDVRLDGGAQPPLPLSRGGNTLVLRLDLLERFENQAARIDGRIVRRSDMMWARLVHFIGGGRFMRGRLVVMQDRSGPGHSDFSAEKLLDDMRGSALVKAIEALLVPERGDLERALDAYRHHRLRRLEQVQRSEAMIRTRLAEMQAQIAQDLRQRARWFSMERLCRSALDSLRSTLIGLADAYASESYLDGLPSEEELSDVRRFLSERVLSNC